MIVRTYQTQRAAVGVTAAKAIVEFASTGEHDPDTIYAYA